MTEQTRRGIGSRLRMARTMRALTIETLAVQTGIPAPTITTWELGRSAPPADHLQKLCDALQASADWIVGTKSDRPLVLINESYEHTALDARVRTIALERDLRRLSVTVGPAVVRVSEADAGRRLTAVDDHVESLPWSQPTAPGRDPTSTEKGEVPDGADEGEGRD